MDWWLQAAIILGMFILRLAVPLVIVLLVGYWLRRLDARWQAEAQAQWEASRTQQEPEPVQSKVLERLNQPCWLVKDCPPATCVYCPAFRHAQLPCWLVRRSPEGRLPETCYKCEVFLYGQLGRSPFVGNLTELKELRG
jgi:hypothetical protein